MERAARVLRKSKQPRNLLNDDRTLEAVWPVAVGSTIARHTSRIRLVRTNLVVDAEDVIWQRQLRPLEFQILDRVRALLPDITIESVEFRVAIPRRQPQSAAATSSLDPFAMPAPAPDEADRILDPVLKNVYQLSRRKATA
jgi:predicted nucleic acid-binding Zn ribbon protein